MSDETIVYVPQIEEVMEVSRSRIQMKESRELAKLYAAEGIRVLEYKISDVARFYIDQEKTRIAWSNRRDNDKKFKLADHIDHINRHMEFLLELEKPQVHFLEKLMEQHPLWEWAKDVKGLGLKGIGLVLGSIGDHKKNSRLPKLSRFPMVSSLWKYSGYDVREDGRAPRREYGKLCGFNPNVRTMTFRVAEAAAKNPHTDYFGIYRRKSDEYWARPRVGPSGCPLKKVHMDKDKNINPCIYFNKSFDKEVSPHIHIASVRIVAKEILKAMWNAWQEIKDEIELPDDLTEQDIAILKEAEEKNSR